MLKIAKLRLKKQAKVGIVFIIIFGLLIFGGIRVYQEYLYRQTYEYKLLQINYSLDETKILINNLKDNELEQILTKEYNELFVLLADEDYFIWYNLERYLNFITKNKQETLTKVVALVNVERDRDFYEDINDVDISKEYLMLVNKYHYLSKDYTPKELIRLELSYAYEGHRLTQKAFNAFKELHHNAKDDGYTIVVNSGYRSYEFQNNLWQSIRLAQGTRRADQLSARPGHSEHQTGFSIDVADFYDGNNDFGKTKAYEWMKENSYKFGFILRYPKDKEDITGYSYEPWHFRYVGIETAEKIFNKDITFDEYYAFFLAR